MLSKYGDTPTICGGADGRPLPCDSSTFIDIKQEDFPRHPLVLAHHITRSVEQCLFKKANPGPSPWRTEQQNEFCEYKHATIEDRMCAKFSASVRQEMFELAPDWCADVLKLTPHV
jgi:hypothetical protein